MHEIRSPHDAAEPWPTPEQAYATAPGIIREIGWTARTAADRERGAHEREYWLRKAAVLDRIALSGESDGHHDDTADVATAAARYLMDLDATAIICDPRFYVRREYARWTAST